MTNISLWNWWKDIKQKKTVKGRQIFFGIFIKYKKIFSVEYCDLQRYFKNLF